jgi:thiol-disulfide isomerase/thioredoxin
MKKLLSLILCGTMVLSLASCSSSKPEETVNTTNGTTTAASKSTEAVVTGKDFDPDFTFRTTDRLGNEWTETAFASNKLTMINFWEPWCGPCVKEMPDLELLYEAYKDKGFQIIGVYSETHMESEVAGILKNKNISYPILNYTDEFARFNTGYVPTTVFVDGNGHIIKMDDGTESIVGSNSYEGWETIIKQYL